MKPYFRIRKTLVNILVAFMPSRRARKRLRKRFLNKPVALNHEVYGRIYTPWYNMRAAMQATPPQIYNKNGRPMELFFLRDTHWAHQVYAHSKYFEWDRYNFGLPTHFYSHSAMRQTFGCPTRKFGMLVESQAIAPHDYMLFDDYPGLAKEFEAVFTYSEKLLNQLPNAKFVPFCAQVWYGGMGGGVIDPQAYQKKTKDISIVSSKKTMCKMHHVRLDLARECQQRGLADTFGNFNGGSLVPIANTLTDYRYSVTLENDITPYFFTERITNCFAAMTIPIYMGASKISEFFNSDGIIQITPKDVANIDKILAQCTAEEYTRRLPAILDNFQRAMGYLNVLDKTYEDYFINV